MNRGLSRLQADSVSAVACRLYQRVGAWAFRRSAIWNTSGIEVSLYCRMLCVEYVRTYTNAVYIAATKSVLYKLPWPIWRYSG